MVKRGAKKTRKEGVFGKRIGKSYEELINFNVLGFLGGGQYSDTSGSLGHSYTEGYTGDRARFPSTLDTSVGVDYDVFKKFPLFKRGSKPHYRIYDLPTNMGIVRSREKSIDARERKIQKYKVEIKSCMKGKKNKRIINKINNRRNWIKEEKGNIKVLKHEMDYRLKFLNEIRKNIDISNKGSLRKPSKNGKWKSYYFRIYWWGKKDSVYLGYEKDLRPAFDNQTKFDDFDEYLKDRGRKRFLMRLGKSESNIRKAHRKLRNL
tara:strand:+ start:2472 stop:3260 length:789 start_codon:yes stop_codon:yes gene_type:complete